MLPCMRSLPRVCTLVLFIYYDTVTVMHRLSCIDSPAITLSKTASIAVNWLFSLLASLLVLVGENEMKGNA